MTQSTNDENEANDSGFTWARHPGNSSENAAPAEPTAATPAAPAAEATGPVTPSAAPAYPAQATPPAAEPTWNAPAQYQAPAAPAYQPPAYPSTQPVAQQYGQQQPQYGQPHDPQATSPQGPTPWATDPARQNTAVEQSPWVADATPGSGQYATAGAPQGYPGYPGQPQPGQPGHSGAAFGGGAGQPPAPPENASWSGNPNPGNSKRQPRRPGWAGVFAVGFGAAALASLLTAGIVHQTDDNSNSSASSFTVAPDPVKGPVSASNASAPNWGAVAKAVEPSVVAVKVTGSTGAGEGSGVILDKTGRIVTNNHVVSGVGSNAVVTVVLNDGRTYPATVVGTDSSTDLAVIKVSNPPANLTPAVLGTSGSVAVGDPVMAVGNPLGLAGTVTTGIVSATDRPTTTQAESTDPNSTASNDPVVTNAIQTDAAVNPGNSGGALVDSQGRVIGVPSSIASLSDSSQLGGDATQSGSIGLGFAIPIDEVKNVASQLIKGGTVAHSWLGVTVAAGTVKVDGASQDDAVLKAITSGSPADRAGLKAGDAVIAVDGKQVNSDLALVGLLREDPVNTVVTLTTVRDGKTSAVKVTLGTRPANDN